MSYASAVFPVTMGRELIASATPLVLPLVLVLWSRHAARQRKDPEERKTAWLGYMRLSRFVMAATLASWWAAWDLNRLAVTLPPFVPWLSSWLEPSSVETLLFWIPPIASLGASLALVNVTSAAVLKLKWTPGDVRRLVWWRTMNFVVPLLMIATGFDDVLGGDLWGTAWISAAGVVVVVATIFLRKAEGMRLHEVKASETRNRALAMARRMRVDLSRIYVVPAGRGHLTNAFGGSRSIILADSLGKYLDRRQMDFVLAHELAHVQHNHGRKNRRLTIVAYLAITPLLYWFRSDLTGLRPLVDVGIIVVPLAVYYFFSRRFEYEADRRAVEFTGDPESAISALAGLQRVSGQPGRCSRFAEAFFSHPALDRRVKAICRAAALSPEKVTEVIGKEFGPTQ